MQLQLDFHVEYQPTRCACKQQYKKPAYQMLNNEHVYFKWSLPNETDLASDQYPSKLNLSEPSWPRLTEITIKKI